MAEEYFNVAWAKAFPQVLKVKSHDKEGRDFDMGKAWIENGGTVAAGLLNPIFWVLYLFWLTALSSGFDPMFPRLLLFLSLFNLLAGNGAFIYLSMLAPIRRGLLGLVPFSLTVFGYWVLMSIAAYKGLWQLIHNPFYWEKTQHGVSRHAAANFAEIREASR